MRVDIAIIDEAQKMQDLEVIVDEVVMPSLMDSNGYLLMFGTVPKQLNHPFIRRYIKEAKRDGAYAVFDIYSAGYPPEQIAAYRKEVSKEAWEREFECKFDTNNKFRVTPGFSSKYIVDMSKPDYFQYLNSYTAMDIGGSLDQTHIPYAYYDSVLKKLIVVDESVWPAQESRVDQIAKAVKEKERAMTKKILRVSDTNNFILIKELAEKHKVRFDPVKKGPGSLEAQLEILNIWIENDRIFISPKCKILIQELKTGSWNRTRTDLERSEGSHCDGLIALAYMLTIVNERGSIKAAKEEGSVFIPPPKDPLNLKAKKTLIRPERASDESFEFKDVTSDIWRKELL